MAAATAPTIRQAEPTSRRLSHDRPVPRRGLSRVEAAVYVGVSPTKFDEMVADGRMPPPKSIDARRVWDMRKLDVAFDALDEQTTDAPDSWGDV